MRRFTLATEIAAPVERCFDLSRDIDFHQSSMAASGERAVAGVTSGLIGPGESVTWEARHFGVRWRVTSRITEFDPPKCFVDEMEKGPFSKFRHEHRFESLGDRTRMIDVVELQVRAPFHAVGDRIAVAYMRRLMRLRNQALRARAETN